MTTSTFVRRSRSIGVLLSAAMMLAACGGDASQTGVAVIETEIADQLELGPLEADCEQPDDREEGVEFACTATTEDDELIRLVAEFESDDRIFVYPTNVVPASDMDLLASEAAEVLGPEVDATIDPADIECPDRSVVLDDDGQLTCTITDPANGDRYELVATLDEYVREQGFESRFYEITELIEN